MEGVFSLGVAMRLARLRAPVVICISPALLSAVPALALRRYKQWRVGVVVQDLYGAALAEAGISGDRGADLAARLERSLLLRADAVSVIHHVFGRYLTKLGLDPERIGVVPNWSHVTIPDVDRAEARRHLGWADDQVIALHAGNMGSKQGLETLVDVASAAERAGSRVRIALLGDGSRRQALENYAGSLGHLSFMDPLPEGEFEAALVAADVLLLNEKPGVFEMSVPSKLTSYFAAGRPVVAATAMGSGAADLVERSGAGEIVTSGDPEAILAAIETIAQDSQQITAYGDNGRRFAAEALAESASMAAYHNWVARLSASDDWGRRSQ
jgi:glycosyltransferase involved in cell wall biosynthesis